MNLAVPVPTDNQPIAARFFGEGRYLTEFITPNNLEICDLHAQLTKCLPGFEDRVRALWDFVTTQIRYKPFIGGSLRIEGKTDVKSDVWLDPSMTIQCRVGNCANKSFLMTSLLRRELDDSSVFCVLGNLASNGKKGGHAWVQINYNDEHYIVETTTDKVPPMVVADVATRYEAVHYFNDQQVLVVPGRTVLTPFSAVYSEWLSQYLDWAYIESANRNRGL